MAPIGMRLPTVDITSPHSVFAGQPLCGVPNDGEVPTQPRPADPPFWKVPVVLTDATVRGLWLAITALSATLIGIAAGVLSWLGGLNPPTAILTGGGAFGGTVLLALAVLRFAGSAED
jgi:hypothetical protein